MHKKLAFLCLAAKMAQQGLQAVFSWVMKNRPHHQEEALAFPRDSAAPEISNRRVDRRNARPVDRGELGVRTVDVHQGHAGAETLRCQLGEQEPRSSA